MIAEFPLFLFTTLGGLAAGAYAVAACLPSDGGAETRSGETGRAWIFPIACIALLGVGLLGVLGHLGRPERFLLALSNPSSMIAEEAYWSIAFGLLMLVDLVLLACKGASSRAVRALAGACGIVLMCIMGWAYFTSYGNPAWAVWPTLPLFVLGDLAMGAALVGALDGGWYHVRAFVGAAVAFALAAAASMGAACAQFAAVGRGIAPFVVGAVLAVVAAAFALAAHAGKLAPRAASWIAFACVLVGVVVARYAFYAASIL